jgi:hypothetical protein
MGVKRKERKQFFFEKKNQKTFTTLTASSTGAMRFVMHHFPNGP